MKNLLQERSPHQISTDPNDDQDDFSVPRDSAVRFLKHEPLYTENSQQPTSTFPTINDELSEYKYEQAFRLKNQDKKIQDTSKQIENAPKNQNQGFLSILKDKFKTETKSQDSSETENENNEVVPLEISQEKFNKSLSQSKSRIPSANNSSIHTSKDSQQKNKGKESTISTIKKKIDSITKDPASEPRFPSPTSTATPPKGDPFKSNFLKKAGSKIISVLAFKNEPGENHPDSQGKNLSQAPAQTRPMTRLQKISKPLHNRLLMQQKEKELEMERNQGILESLGYEVLKRKPIESKVSSEESEISDNEAEALRTLSKKRKNLGITSDTEGEEHHPIPMTLLTFLKDKVTGEGLIPTKKAAEKDTRLKTLLEKHAIRRMNTNDVKNLVEEVMKKDKKISIACIKLRNRCKSISTSILLLYYKWRIPFDPKKPFKMAWDIYIGVLIFWNISYIPFDIAFGTAHDETIFGIEVFLTIFFFLDILISFHTGYYKDHHFIQSHRKIFKKYFSGWFWVDLVSSLPLGTILLTNDDYEEHPLLRLLSIIKIARVFKLARIFKIKKILEEFRDTLHLSQLTQGIFKFVKLLCIVLFTAHCVACLWFYVSRMSILNGQNGWINNKLELDDDISTQYLTSLYWTITTMMTVGYGDITPVSQTEKIFTMCIMLFGCGLFGYCINKVAEIIGDINREYSYQSNKKFFLNKYLKTNQIDEVTQNKARHYLNFVFDVQAETQSEETEVIGMLSDNLKETLAKAVNAQALRKCIIIRDNFGSTFVSLLSSLLENKIYSPDETIFMEGEHGNECLYFIKRGHIETYIKKYNVHLKNLGHGSCFGESNFMTQKAKSYSAKSLGFSSIFKLKLTDFLRLAEDYPSEKEMYHMIKDRINLNNEHIVLSSKCLLCQRITHNLYNCPLLFPQTDRISVIDTYLKEYEEFMAGFERNGRRTRNALSHFQFHKEKALLFQKTHNPKKTSQSVVFDQDDEKNNQTSKKNVKRKFQEQKFKRMKSDIDNIPKKREMTALPRMNMKTNNFEDEFVSSLAYGELFNEAPVQELAYVDTLDLDFAPEPKNTSRQSVGSSEKLEAPASKPEILLSVHFDEEQDQRFQTSLEIIEEIRDEHEHEETPKNKKPIQKSIQLIPSKLSLKPEKEKVFTPHFMLRPPPRFIEDEFVFDVVKNYEIYLPQNNATKVADDINAKIEHRRKVDVGLYTQDDINIFKLKLGRISSRLKRQRKNSQNNFEENHKE